MRAYDYRHVVSFEETNLVGNVYYVNLLRWQGRCRELFLREHAPEVLPELGRGLCLVTTRCSCEFLAELGAFDEVVVRMRLAGASANGLALAFEYWRQREGSAELVGRGEQGIACVRREGGAVRPAPVPAALRRALEPYARPGPEGARG
jgi:enediyne biosynthesis thioesterase